MTTAHVRWTFYVAYGAFLIALYVLSVKAFLIALAVLYAYFAVNRLKQSDA